MNSPKHQSFRRSLAWVSMVKHIRAAGGFSLPHCPACNTLFYPPQRFCPKCLNGHIEYQADTGVATVLSSTRLHVTFDETFATGAPVQVVNVRTDTGVTLFAFADEPFSPGCRVAVYLEGDEVEGAESLHARPLLSEIRGEKNDELE